MTTPEIPEEAVEAAARAIAPHWFDRDCPGPEREIRQQASRALAAALPHLRVQETDWRATDPDTGELVHLCMGLTADGQGPADPPDPQFDHWGCWCVDATCPGPPHPRPVVDREALVVLAAEWKQSADEDEGYLKKAHASEIHDVYASIRINREHADAVLALLVVPTEEVPA